MLPSHLFVYLITSQICTKHISNISGMPSMVKIFVNLKAIQLLVCTVKQDLREILLG